MHGLAVPGTVIRDCSCPAAQLYQAIEHCQSTTGFVVSGDWPPDRPACAVVVGFHPQATAGVRHADLDRPVGVLDSIGGQLADDELGEFGVLAKTPFAKCLTGLLAGLPDLDWVVAQLAGHGMLAVAVNGHLLARAPSWVLHVGGLEGGLVQEQVVKGDGSGGALGGFSGSDHGCIAWYVAVGLPGIYGRQQPGPGTSAAVLVLTSPGPVRSVGVISAGGLNRPHPAR